MLKGIPKILSPELLKILSEMGHGDEIVLADGNFPAESLNSRTVRSDGHGAVELLKAILGLIPLDGYAECNFVLMQTTKGDPKPAIWAEYEQIERFAFYERAKRAYAVIATGESALYANIILKKGVIV